MVLVIWIVAGIAPQPFVQGQIVPGSWDDIVAITSLILSMAVNLLVTGLIVFRLFEVFRQVKTATADDQILGVTGGSKLRRIIFILIESDMELFLI